MTAPATFSGSPGAPAGPRFSFSTLQIGSIDDPLEHEADRIADQVMRMPDQLPSLTVATGQVSRKCACEEDERELLQAKPSGPVPGAAPPVVQHALNSPGRPLDSQTRDFFEPRFRRDFRDVRIHTDSAASDSARSINALAYTVGRHVVLADGEYSPGTSMGRRLLAHELAHVVQQGATGTVRRAPNPKRTWHPRYITAGLGMPFGQEGPGCSASTNTVGVNQVCGDYSGRSGDEFGCRTGIYSSDCQPPCVGRPLNLEPHFWVDVTEIPRPKPFAPPRLAMTVRFHPESGDSDTLTRETGTGQYDEPGALLKTGMSDLSFFTPDSPGTLTASVALADPDSGAVAVYSDSIPVKTCPVVATDPEPEKPKPRRGRQTRFNIEVRDPDNAPQVYQFIDAQTPLEGPGGFFAVWQDTTGAYYYLNDGRQVELPDFAPP